MTDVTTEVAEPETPAVTELSYIERRKPVREMTAGDAIDQAFVVSKVENKQKKDGVPYIVFMLSDRTSEIEMVAWDDVERMSGVKNGDILRAQGRVEVHEQFGPRLIPNMTNGQLHVRAAKDDEYNIVDLVQGPQDSVASLCARLDALLKTVTSPPIVSLLTMIFNDDETYERFVDAPAALKVHQAYKHGLLEHTVTVAEGVRLMAGNFPGEINYDLALAGALLHDIGKINVYALDGYTVSMTTHGMLFGELPLTFHLVSSCIEQISEDFDDNALFDELLHIICSHHGRVEHGASVAPATRAATLVHFVDNLGGRLGSFDRVESKTPATQEFSDWDKSLGSRVWMGASERRQDEPVSDEE
jgi:3'-5' exoribonuclease